MTLIIVLLQSHKRSYFHDVNNGLHSLTISLVVMTSIAVLLHYMACFHDASNS
jgi:hypothetical protein